MSETLSSQYIPDSVEEKWEKIWLASGIFSPHSQAQTAPYSIVIPPPNVTGSLHMGHALNSTLQDILIRYHRMKGDNTLWVVGTDHAGIATQNVVEKQIAAEGKSRNDYTREKFIERVWNWKAESGGTIIKQLKRLGASCDFDRERFTMDEGLSQAVRKVFVQLYKENLIYRGNRLINWCPRCQTALSDLEVEHEQKKGKLWHIKYPLCDAQGKASEEFLIVATTRPETLFGDTAIAIHPEDTRYQNLKLNHVLLPLVDKTLPIIKDNMVDLEFGSGAVKITPAHDFNDEQTGRRHHLPIVNIFTSDAKMIANYPIPEDLRGLDRFKAREATIKKLTDLGLIEKEEEHANSVGHCYRCKTVVEPFLTTQWYVSTKPLAEKAIAAVKTGQTKFIPEHWNKTYFQWMENIQDWCISRQIWWGHQIPAWYCENKNCPPIVSESDPTTCSHCNSTNLQRDPDVLDTWFSSALWPFSTLGWPEKTEMLKTFYPTSVLVTAFDIIFFWVARMMMMGIHFMGEVPFKDVYIHALVRDPLGQKMSKSKGNVVDPLIMMKKYGTDAFRFTLAAFAAQGRDIKLDEQRIEGYRHFCNKIWNATRFALMSSENIEIPQNFKAEQAKLPFNRWILTRLSELGRELPEKIESYEFNQAASLLHRFFWNEFCDWYIELTKSTLREGHEVEKQETTGTLLFVLENAMLLLHPFMPFLTEELAVIILEKQGKKGENVFLTTQKFPEFASYDFAQDHDAVQTLIQTIAAIRSIRQDTGLKVGVPLRAQFLAPSNAATSLQNASAALLSLAKLESFKFIDSEPTEACALGLAGEIQVYIPLAGLIDVNAEKTRLEKKKLKLEGALQGLLTKLNNEEFIKNAPPELVSEQNQMRLNLMEDLKLIERAVKLLKT